MPKNRLEECGDSEVYAAADLFCDTEIDFEVVERDKDGLISKLKVEAGDFVIMGDVPFNMSTLKSQIRNGRLILQSMVKDEFEMLDSLYL